MATWDAPWDATHTPRRAAVGRDARTTGRAAVPRRAHCAAVPRCAQGATTSARVYLDLHGPYDELTTGEIRLVHGDSHQACFQRGALDHFLVTARDVGLPRVIKIWHDNTGRHPDWCVRCAFYIWWSHP